MSKIYDWLKSDEFKHNRNAVVFEIGSHNGSDTIQMDSIFTNTSFHCFEPDPRAYKKLQSNIGDLCNSIGTTWFTNTKTGNIFKVFNIAITDSCKYVEFTQSSGDYLGQSDWDFSGTIVNPKNHIKNYPTIKFKNKILVEGMCLDRYHFYHKILCPIDFVYMDVQGAELFVIKGGSGFFFDYTRYLYTEFDDNEEYDGNSSLDNILHWLKTYEIIFIDGNNVLLKNNSMKSVV